MSNRTFPVAGMVLIASTGSLIVSESAHAQTTWHVDVAVCPAVGSGSTIDPFCRIQSALDAAGSGDEVRVRPGEYLENLVNFDTPVTLRSTSGPTQTIVTAAAPGNSVLHVRDQPPPYTTVDGFTFRGGQSLIGGGVTFTHTRPTLRNCIIRDNHAFRGGGVFNFGSFARMENCLIINNEADDEGGGVFDDHGFITAVNCTIAANLANTVTGGFRVKSATKLHNCVIWGNQDMSGSGETVQTNCGAIESCVAAHSCIQNISSLSGNGNFGSDPLFVNPLEDDYRVQQGSPCIDAGDNNQVATTTDLDGHPRLLDDPATPDTGVGAPPIVDVGAYEFGDDCNDNGIADADDIAQGTSDDCNANGVPDECEPDCNGNERPDSCDITLGESDDCTSNGLPDECEPDCNANSLADSCDISTGTSTDCNANSIPDECDIASGTSMDLDQSGLPDECERPVVAVHGSRYVHVAALAGDAPIAMYLTSPDYPCLDKYLTHEGLVVDTPVYVPSWEWQHVHAHGAELLPGTRYQVGIEAESGHRFPPVSFETWGFGNVKNNEGTPSFQDIFAVIQVFQGNTTTTTFLQADLHPCLPNGMVNFADINVAVIAFMGGHYLTLCPPPCTTN